jgi:purine-binding chemotaxis protein CheW
MNSSRAEAQALAAALPRAGGAAPLPRSAGDPAGEAGPARQYLTFAVGSECFAAAIQAIREILEVPPLTVVPRVPPFVRGVINLRGAVVPVIDLASRFDLGHTELARRTCVVVVEVAAGPDTAEAGEEGRGARGATRQVLGLLVDAVHEVQEIAEDDVEPTPALGTHIDPEFLGGMARVNGQLMGVLDLGRVLQQQELARLVARHLAA